MPTSQQLLADFVDNSLELFVRFLPGFTEEDLTTQAPHLPNHLAWTLGHLALYMNRAAELIAEVPFPADDFVTGDGRQGGEERYDTESVAFGSTPVDDPSLYPSLARGRTIFDVAGQRLAHAARGLSGEALEHSISWGRRELTATKLILRMCDHNAHHAGQIVDLRRALGLGRIMG